MGRKGPDFRSQGANGTIEGGEPEVQEGCIDLDAYRVTPAVTRAVRGMAATTVM